VLAFIALVLVVGLVIDGSFAWVKRREAQNAADFAAMAGTRIVLLNAQGTTGLTDGTVATAIVTTAQANGATVPGLGTSAGPYYTDQNGDELSTFVGLTTSSAAIPAAAAGVLVPGATISWHPLVLGIIGVSSWSAGASATARFTPGTTGTPCSYASSTTSPRPTA